MKQMYSEAITELQTVRATVGNVPYGLGDIGYAYGISGKMGEARKVLEELTGFSQQGYEVQDHMALTYHGLGVRENTLVWLEKAVDAQTYSTPFLRCEPLW